MIEVNATKPDKDTCLFIHFSNHHKIRECSMNSLSVEKKEIMKSQEEIIFTRGKY